MALAGTWPLVRLIVRRDRWLLLPWVLLMAAYPLAGIANATDAYVNLARNPGFLMLWGPLHGRGTGAIATWSSGDLLWAYGLVSLLFVIRHTRAEEEAGRRELLGSTVVGRQAGLAAALIVTLAANLVLAMIMAAGAVAQDLPVAGSIALGLRFAAVGWVFAAVGALAAQLTETAAAARGLAVAVLGGTFLLRAAGDSGGPEGGASWLSWISPLGLANQIRPFAGERWWILAIFVGTVAVLAGLARALSARRDVGAGVLRARPGPATATQWLGSPLALAWRLQWRALLGWAAGFAVIGGVFGGAAESAGELFREGGGLADVFERLGGAAGASDVFLAAIMSILGLVAAATALQAAGRLRSEETEMRAEPVLATAVGRLRWSSSHLVFSIVAPAFALASAGLTAGLVYGLSVGDVGRELPRVLAAAMVQLPGAWMLSGIAVALFGLVPRWAFGGWVAWVVFLLIWSLGAFGQVSQWVLDVSPFTHLPKLPGGEMSVTPVAWLAAGAAALGAIGLVGFRRRDVGRS